MPILEPENVRLARASWDAASMAHRVFLLLRSRYSMRRGIEPTEADLFSSPWADLPPETCEAIAWDVQFMRQILVDGKKALVAEKISHEVLQFPKK